MASVKLSMGRGTLLLRAVAMRSDFNGYTMEERNVSAFRGAGMHRQRRRMQVAEFVR